jgi:ribosomal-protein-alanine N-acetyltransferase
MTRIERMTAADIDAVAAIEVAAFPAYASPDVPPPHARWTEELARTWTRAWVARDGGGAVVGFLIAWHVVDELHVLNVATAASFRRKGIGRALVGEALAYGRASDVRIVLLEVRRSNRAALALYQGLGFTELGVRLRYYPDGEDAIEMTLSLG